MNKLKGIIYNGVGWLATKGYRKKPAVKKLLIVRVDEIGDYVLWHVFIQEIVNADQFKGYKIHFCGNQSWKTLFNTFDAKWVDRSFWMDKVRFKKEMTYRYRFLKLIYRQGYDTVINPTFSRDKRNDDSIVKVAKAPETFGMKANLESVQPYELGYDHNLYTKLFDYPGKPIFEFFRNRLFTEFVTNQISQVANTQVDQTILPVVPVALPKNYFVIFPGSRSKKRIWPTENFVRVSNYIFETHGWTTIVCGTLNDAAYINAFCDQYKHPCINLVAKTSLVEMLGVFKNAKCLFSVDTGSVHLAAAVGCTVFGIFNGSQYKRFAPYPAEVSDNVYAIYPDDVEQELKDPALVKQKYEFVVPVPYASVKPEKMILAIHHHFLK
ncbi:MAG: glycosyltransferase family 9 protein [Sediminibacterium sp.]